MLAQPTPWGLRQFRVLSSGSAQTRSELSSGPFCSSHQQNNPKKNECQPGKCGRGAPTGGRMLRDRSAGWGPQRDPTTTPHHLTPMFFLSAAEALASPTPCRPPDPPGQGWAGETPASSRSPPATSPPPAWGCWGPVGCWAPPSAAPPPAPPSSSKAGRLVTARYGFLAFPPQICPDFPFLSPRRACAGCGVTCGRSPPCRGAGKRDRDRGAHGRLEGENEPTGGLFLCRGA